jgi:hypothetical protein
MGSKPARAGGGGAAARGDPFLAGVVVAKIGLLIWPSTPGCCCCCKFGDFILLTGDKFSGLVGDES